MEGLVMSETPPSVMVHEKAIQEGIWLYPKEQICLSLCMPYFSPSLQRLFLLESNSKYASLLAAKSLYSRISIHSLRAWNAFVYTILSPKSIHPYAAFVVDVYIPSTLSLHMLQGDIDTALQLFPHLQRFHLVDSTSSTNILIQSIADNSSQLQELVLQSCPITDALLPSLISHCPQLVCIDFSFTLVSVSSLYLLLNGLHKLKRLVLDQAQPGTLQSMKPPSSSSPLEYFSCKKTSITDHHLLFISQCCPFLRHLVLQECDHVSDVGVGAVVMKAKHYLTLLDVSFCPLITNVTVYALAFHSALYKLNTVILSGLNEVEPEAIMKLVQMGCPYALNLIVLHGCMKIVDSFIAHYSTRELELDCSLKGQQLKWLALHAVPVPKTLSSIAIQTQSMEDATINLKDVHILTESMPTPPLSPTLTSRSKTLKNSTTTEFLHDPRRTSLESKPPRIPSSTPSRIPSGTPSRIPAPSKRLSMQSSEGDSATVEQPTCKVYTPRTFRRINDENVVDKLTSGKKLGPRSTEKPVSSKPNLSVSTHRTPVPSRISSSIPSTQTKKLNRLSSMSAPASTAKAVTVTASTVKSRRLSAVPSSKPTKPSLNERPRFRF